MRRLDERLQSFLSGYKSMFAYKGVIYYFGSNEITSIPDSVGESTFLLTLCLHSCNAIELTTIASGAETDRQLLPISASLSQVYEAIFKLNWQKESDSAGTD